MIPLDRRSFLKTLTYAGVAVFAAHHLRAIDQDLTNPLDPKVVVGPYRKTWTTLYAESESEGYRITFEDFASNFDENYMTWREVLKSCQEDEHLDVLKRLDALDYNDWANGLEYACEHEPLLQTYYKKTKTKPDAANPPTWEEVLDVTDRDVVSYIRDHACTNYPQKFSELSDACSDWPDYVGPMNTPEGMAYQEIRELLDTVEACDSELGEAARECVEFTEGSGPGCDFHGVYVKTREDLGILRRILHATGQKVNIMVG